MRSTSSKYFRLEYSQIQQTPPQSSSINLTLNKNSYYQGEFVSGTVFLKTREDYLECELFLELEGKETLRIPIRGRPLVKERLIVQERSCIYSCEMLYRSNTLTRFKFLLPKDIPASFFQLFGAHKRLSASIQYKLRASFRTRKEEQVYVEKNVAIYDRLRSELKSISEEIIYDLSSCCIPIGTTVLRANFEKNHYSPGETATLIVEVDNSSSKMDNFTIAFSLIHKLKVKIGCTPYSETIRLGYDGLFETGRKLKKTLILQVRIPSSLSRKTTKGRFIESKYFLEVSCLPNFGSLCGDPAKIICPIELIDCQSSIREVHEPRLLDAASLSIVEVDFFKKKLMKNKNCKDSFEMANPQMP